MDDIDDEALIDVLVRACSDAAADDFQSIVGVASRLRQLVGDNADSPISALVAALEYHLVMNEERRAPYGPFGPMIEADGRAYPPAPDRIDAVVPGVLALWERALRVVPLALVRARFADLLWEAKYGPRPHEFAQAAIDAYVEAAVDDFGHPVERCDAAQRAVEIASRINDQVRRARAVDAGVALTKFALASDERMPGVAVPLLEVFVQDTPERRPPELEALLEEATDRFGDDPWNLESVLELRARLLPIEERSALREREVVAFRDLAHQSAGLVKYAHLQHAIQLAEQHGLRTLADEIRHEVEAMSTEELDLKEVSAEISIPRDQVDAFIDWFVGDDNIESAMTRFGSYLPTGELDENREYVAQLMSDHPVQFLFTRMTIGPENSLIRSTEGQEDQAEQALIDHEAQLASTFSLFAVDILQRIVKRYGPVSSAASWFENDLIAPAVAAKIGRAIELFESDDPDSAAAVLAPRLERVVRRIATTVGLTVTRSPDSHGRSGGVKGLGEVLGLLQGPLHEPTRRYLKVLLSEVTGLNLRNRIGHGLDDEIAQREAALLIHAACRLRLLTPGE